MYSLLVYDTSRAYLFIAQPLEVIPIVVIYDAVNLRIRDQVMMFGLACRFLHTDCRSPSSTIRAPKL